MVVSLYVPYGSVNDGRLAKKIVTWSICECVTF